MSNASSKPKKATSLAPATQAETKEQPLYGWKVSSAIILILISFIVLPIIAQIVVSSVPSFMGWSTDRGDQWAQHSAFGNFLYVLLAEFLTAGLLIWFIRHKKRPFRQVVGLNRPHWKYILYGLAGVLCYFGIFIVTLTAINAIIPIDTSKEQAIGFEKGIGGADLWLAFASLVILPPIVEEMVFRGFFYGTLRARNISMPWAVAITSLSFATLHLFGSGDGSLLWIAFIDTFVLSIVLCYLRETTGSIWPTILVHALKNGFVFVNLFILGTT
jgi:uncharacterized protein